MKVLIVTGSYPPDKCGVGDYAANLSKSLTQHTNIEVNVLTSVSQEKYSDAIDNLKVFPVMPSWGVLELFRVVKLLWRQSPDIVHIQYPTQGYADGLLPCLIPLIAYLMQKKVVQTWHEIYANPYDPRILAQAIIPGGLIVVRPEYLKKLKPELQWTIKNKHFKFIRNASTIPSVNLSSSEKIKLKNHYKKIQPRLIVFFGFIYEHKGTDLIFDIADPELDQIVIAGEFDRNNSYHQKILNIANNEQWKDKVSVTGFLEPNEIGSLLSVADAVILPFRVGGGEWNTTIHSAVLQKTFVLTTSESASGYDEVTNVYYAKIGDIGEMRQALELYAGKYRKHNDKIDVNEWEHIASEHQAMYQRLI